VNIPAAASPLLFGWSPPQPRRRALFLFLIASAILHAVGFYIFQVVYPPTVALLPPPARLNIISPDDPDSVALLRWVQAEDPALASTTRRPPDYQPFTLPNLEHLPSYENHQPQLKSLPQTEPDLTIPASTKAGRMPRVQPVAALPLLIRKTVAVFADLPAESTPTFPAFTFHLSRADAPANARFRIAIDRAGAIKYCFLMDSAGDPALDEQARQFLLLCRFRPAGSGQKDDRVIWSIATILWGNDFAPANSVTPAP
jgi:hypothetical protein